MHSEILPLFPLSNVLLPGGRVPLRVFEPRYVDMIRRCMRDGAGFGVVLIRSGREVRGGEPDEAPPNVCAIGTRAEIIDFDQLEDGLLGIIAAGRERIRIRRTDVRPDHLVVGGVERIAEPGATRLPAAHAELAELLGQLAERLSEGAGELEVDWDDAGSIAWRLTELLPIDAFAKQAVLELDGPRERLLELERLVAGVREATRE